jgi:hypothetical protein
MSACELGLRYSAIVNLEDLVAERLGGTVTGSNALEGMAEIAATV